MKLFIQQNAQTQAIEVPENLTFEVVAKMVNAVALFYAGQILSAKQEVSMLQQDSTIIAVSPIDGAGKDKKRKKKAKKTPKKKSHVQKKNKLALLKLYKVQGDKVDSLRAYCKNCGPAVRMAKHANRTHCGRCGWNGKWLTHYRS